MHGSLPGAAWAAAPTCCSQPEQGGNPLAQGMATRACVTPQRRMAHGRGQGSLHLNTCVSICIPLFFFNCFLFPLCITSAACKEVLCSELSEPWRIRLLQEGTACSGFFLSVKTLCMRFTWSLSSNVPVFLSYNPVYLVLVLFVPWSPYCCLRKGWRLLYCRFPCGHFWVPLGSDLKSVYVRYPEKYVKCLCAYLLLKLWLFGIIWSFSWYSWNNSQIRDQWQ